MIQSCSNDQDFIRGLNPGGGYASWIGLTENHINTLQNFQDGFIRSALKLAESIPKALLTWDIGLMPMKWRIAQKKLIFLNNLMKRDISNLAKHIGSNYIRYICNTST